MDRGGKGRAAVLRSRSQDRTRGSPYCRA